MRNPESIAHNLIEKLKRDGGVRALVYMKGQFNSLPRSRLTMAHNPFLVGVYDAKCPEAWVEDDINYVLVNGCK